ncbi:MAG: hypothetical protein HY791_08090 [Deltaproteobacteria bacterium]|nr:hypothetical protein [Deltaproteobacteria bacterium]
MASARAASAKTTKSKIKARKIRKASTRKKPTRKKPTRKKPREPIPHAWTELAKEVPFGPLFFLEKLADFVRDKSPSPDEGLPLVHLHLADGEVLDLSHVIGMGDHFAAFAVYEGSESPNEKLRTELVPFEMIIRISVRAPESAQPQIGFKLEAQAPTV